MMPKKDRRRRSGKWDGLTAKTVSELMGSCSADLARLMLRRLTKKLDRKLTVRDIGDMIYEYRRKPQDKTLEELLTERWIGPNSL